MLGGFELRFERALREEIQEQMGGYTAEMDGIDFTKPGAVVLAAQTHERFTTFEEVLSIMDSILEKMGE